MTDGRDQLDDLRRENESLRQRNEQLEAQEKLRESQRLFRAVFDGALDAMLLADDSGKYVDANLAASTLFGLLREELIGRSIADFAPPDALSDPSFQAFLSRTATRGELRLRRADGSLRRLEYGAVANVAPSLHLLVLRDVTDRVMAEEALRRSEALFRALIEKSAEVMSLTGADGTTRYLTPLAWRAVGWTPAELGPRTMRDLVVPEDRVRLTAELDRMVRTGARDMSMEFRVQRRDGSIGWVESTGTNLLDDPDVAAIVGNYRDITARKHADEALRKSEESYRRIVESTTDGIWIYDANLITTFMNGRMAEMLGYSVEEAIGRPIFEFMESSTHDQARERVARHMEGLGDRGELAYLRKDGSKLWTWYHATPLIDASGHTEAVLVVVTDASSQRRADQALRESEERYRRIIETTSEGIWLSNADRITTFVNQRMADMLGYTVEEMIGQPLSTFISDEGRAVSEVMFGRRIHEHSQTFHNSYRKKDGTSVWALAKTNAIFDAAGKFEGTIGLLTDMTETRKFEEERARLAAIVESSEDAIISADLDAKITTWNLGAEKLYQFSAAEMIGKSLFLLVPPALVDEEHRILERIVRGEPVGQYETERRRKDGSIVPVAVTMSTVRDARGAVIGLSKIVRDLTRRKQTEAALHRTEEQFRHAQKMEAVGRLAGGVAHDFNNLLSVILSYASLTIDELKPGDPVRNDVDEITKAGNRAAELTKQLLAFSRQQILQPRVIDLNQILVGMNVMLTRLLGEDIELTLQMDSALGRVRADAGQLEQVVMNLAVNARDAMPNGGKLTIETKNIVLDASYVSAHLGVTPGNYVMLAISDTGTGMSAETRARMFEPFFTTKDLGKGTGLGLATVFGIVQQSGGHVDVYSELGQGSAFKVYLPRTDRDAEAAVATLPPAALMGSETILLVEDEDAVRAVASTILRRNGYHVLEASNGGDALLVSKNFTETIHLLVTDVVMPRMSGRQLAEQLAPLRPEMKVLFASGYTDDSVVRHGVLDEGVAFLQKPFTPDGLLRRIREVLDAKSQSTAGKA